MRRGLSLARLHWIDFGILTAATMPHESPMEASNPQTDGRTPVERENALWKSVPASCGRDFYPDVVSHPASEQLHTDGEASSSVSEGTQPPLDQHLLLTEEGVESSVETAALCDEVSDPAVFLRRRWISDSVSEHEEEPVVYSFLFIYFLSVWIYCKLSLTCQTT